MTWRNSKMGILGQKTNFLKFLAQMTFTKDYTISGQSAHFPKNS